MKLLNGRQLATELGRSQWWVCQAKKAGMPFYCGSTTLQDAITWMRGNPKFTALDYSSTPSNTGRGRPRSGAGKRGGSSRKRVPQTASPSISEPHREQVA